jgi:hypothetical protein
MVPGTEWRRVALIILVMQSTTKDDEGEIMTDVAVIKRKKGDPTQIDEGEI